MRVRIHPNVPRWTGTGSDSPGTGERGFAPRRSVGLRVSTSRKQRGDSTWPADGAAYFMFDGTAYHGECWDPKHGHQVPPDAKNMCRPSAAWHGWSTRSIRTSSSRCTIRSRAGTRFAAFPPITGMAEAAPGEQDSPRRRVSIRSGPSS